MPCLALLGLSLSSLTISNSSSDVLNAQGSPASITSLLALTTQNATHSSTGRVLGGGDGRRRIAARKRQPQGQDSDEGLSSGADEGISSGAITGIVVGSSALVGCVILCWPRSTTPGTTTPGTTTSSTTAETIGAAEIQI